MPLLGKSNGKGCKGKQTREWWQIYDRLCRIRCKAKYNYAQFYWYKWRQNFLAGHNKFNHNLKGEMRASHAVRIYECKKAIVFHGEVFVQL